MQSQLQECVFDRPYSRMFEAEVDKIGLQLAAKARVDTRASSVFLWVAEGADHLRVIPSCQNLDLHTFPVKFF